MRAGVLTAAAGVVLSLSACAGDSDGSSDAGARDPGGSEATRGAERSPGSTLEETEVPFTEPGAPAPESSDVPATLYAVISESLDPRGERLAAYDGTNEPSSGVGAGRVPGGWSLNAEWSPRGLVGIVVAEDWPDGWLCVDAYPGCREIQTAGGAAQALATGRTGISVGFEQPGGSKVIVSAVDIAELSAADLAAAASDERLDLP